MNIWLLLLLAPILRSQVTPKLPAVLSGEMANSSDFSTNTTRSSEESPTELPEFGEVPSEAPTEVEDDWSPAETFLYTGDPSTLNKARCSRAYSTKAQSGSLPSNFNAPLQPAQDALANTANFLNMVFQASDLRESTVDEDMEWYHALVRSLLEADLLIQRALLTFDADPSAPVPQLVLRATRNPTGKQQAILLQDISKTWESLHPPSPAPDDSWFRKLKFPESGQPTASLSKRVLLNDLTTLDTPKWGQGDSYVTNRTGVQYASAPFLDCKDGYFEPGWILTLSTSFYGLKPDLTPEFRGVVRVDVNIQDIDLDQCATGDSWFAHTHQCNRTSMECVPVPGRGFRFGQYCCRCKEGYYNPEISPEDSDGDPINGSESSVTCYPNMPICLPCWPGCKSCRDSTPCWVQEDKLLRAGVLALQGVFMFLVFVSMLVSYQHRQNRRIRASSLLLLETILFGSLLLYFPVFILYFKPSTFRCILLRWVRMLGFSVVYGTITLKMYRVLKVFLSRTAQRMPYISSLHLLRILGVMLMTVSWFLCAWTVGVLQNRDRNIPVFVTATTSDGQGFTLCYLDRWDYMMAVAELLFLCWGSSLWTAVRPVPSAFHEPRYMGIAIHNELLLSSMFHLFRFTFQSLHPDWMLLLSFMHTHVTITVTLTLLLVPKFFYESKARREEIAAEVYEDELDLRRSASYLNNSFCSAWSERSMDPDDFQDELKKLYAQLEVHKVKKMTANNPHLSKKRSSRCALGRSLIKKIAEFPETVSRQCSREERDGSFRIRRGSHSDSFRMAPDSVSISYRSSIKSHSSFICKSQNDHHYVRERGSSFRDSTLRANSVKRSSQRSETDSLDIPPGVCKSASALNLTIDTNLLHPDHTRLHKSWSLSSSTTHSIENIPKISGGSAMQSKQSISISDQTRSALQSESFDKAEVCPWEVEPEQSGDKNTKHVTYASSKDSEEKELPSPQALVCPWDHLPPVEKTPSVDKNSQADSVSPKTPVTVSASAPGTPRPKVTKDQRVLSFRTPTNKWLSVKSFMSSVDSSKFSKEIHLNREDSQKSQESASTTPVSGSSSRRPSMDKKSLQKFSMSTTDGKPSLVKQNAVRLSSTDSSDRSPRRIVIVRSTISPADADDPQKEGSHEHVFLSRQSSKRSSISSWETISSSRTPSTRRRGSNRIRPTVNASYTDVCPGDGASSAQPGEGPKKQQSIKANICSQESQVMERSNVCPWESQDQGTLKGQQKTRVEACPWESHDIPVTPHSMTSKDPQTQSFKVDVCPWENVETPQISIRQDSEYANVCPWEVQDKDESTYENLNPARNKGTLMVPFHHEVMKSAIYPSSSTEVTKVTKAPNTTSPALNSSTELSKAAESCPWDFPDPPNPMEDICPWETGDKEPSHKDSASQMTVNKDVCPWESGHQDKPDVSENTEGTDSNRVNVCPWETESCEKKEVSKTESQRLQSPSKVLRKQDSGMADVCPWETDDPKILKNKDNALADVCPWDTEDATVTKGQDSRENVCPWENEESIVLKKQDSIRENVCPWETEDPKVLKKQDSTRTDVCPWETEETKNKDVCQSSNKEQGDNVNVPTTVAENVLSTNSDTDVTDNRITLEDETPGDMDTEQTDESKANLALGRRDALCPWDIMRSSSGSFTDNTTDIFTWEPENIPEEDEEDDAECAAEALVFPPDL
ncbi:probable G-protein coupled receptor 158 isoform X1 [Poecilia formosa]|uniref:probable G-protein coupled receptor 158 isoform X1 n=1 Tax=Poecilia formosa TaxID=48698 RepID=UPI0004447231|nr:PREDICTED: probable G-protein coupled receptor 179 isoform X1 [Poecilia formosa]